MREDDIMLQNRYEVALKALKEIEQGTDEEKILHIIRGAYHVIDGLIISDPKYQTMTNRQEQKDFARNRGAYLGNF